MPEEKKCIQCGTSLPEDAMFCPECGTKQPAESQESMNAIDLSAVAQTVETVSADASPKDASPMDASMENPFERPVASMPADAPKAEVKMPDPVSSFDPFANASAAKPVDPAQSFQYTMPAPPPEPVPPAYPQQAPPVQPAPQQWMQQPQQTQQPQQMQQPNQMQQPQQPAQQWQQMLAQPVAPPPAMAKGKGARKKAAISETPGEAVPGEKPAAKLPVPTLVILGLTFLGLIYWFLRYNSAKLPPFDFSAATANGVVFSFLLMTILAIAGAALFRFNMRGRKLAVLGDILLVIVLLVMFYGISVTMFKDTNLFYKLFLGITGG